MVAEALNTTAKATMAAMQTPRIIPLKQRNSRASASI
jgi:hypothetical protein